MRNTKQLKIDGVDQEIIVKELRMKDIKVVIKELRALKTPSMDVFLEVADKVLPLVTTLKMDEFMDLAPSEIKQVYDAFLEVNAVFFGMLEISGAMGIFREMKTMMVHDFKALLQDSFDKVTASRGATDTASLQ